MRLRSTVLPAAMLLAALPSMTVADIYSWTDESGRTVLSNLPPAPAAPKSNVKLLVKTSPRVGATAPGVSAPHAATPTEQLLLGKIESLERELQAQRAAPVPPPLPVPPPVDYNAYTAPPPPAPAPATYYAPDYYAPTYYPSYYYPTVPAYSYYVYPQRNSIYPQRRIIATPVYQGHTHAHSYAHPGSGYRGRR